MRAQQVRQYLRFTNPSTYGSATEFAFSVDWSSDAIVSPTLPKRPWITSIGGNTSTVEPELGRASIGSAKIGLLDSRGEMLKYFANIGLTLNGAHDASTTTILVNQDTLGYPALGTVEILTSGVRERVRYTGKTPASFTGCTRGVDGTSAASHSSGDAVANGEQIRRGTRVQLFTGYAHLDESRYRSEWKMEVAGRSMDKDRVTTALRLQDIQRRPSRATIFLAASQDVPVSLCGNPIDCALAILLSQGTFTTLAGTLSKTAGSAAVTGVGTDWNVSLAVGDVVRAADGELLRVASGIAAGTFTAAQNAIQSASGVTARKGGTNGRYDVLSTVDAVGIPSAFVDTATWEALRTSDFSTDQYQFSIVTRANAKTFIEEQFMKTLNCYPKINQTGQLSIVRYRVTVGSPTVTLDADSIIGYEWLPADDQIINVVQFNYDWNITGAEGIYGTFQEFLAGSLTDFTTSIGQVGRTTPLVVEAMGWRTALGGAAKALSRSTQVTDRFAFPQNILILDCTWSRNHLEPGDQVFVNDPRLPNIKTGLRGIANEIFEVLDVTTSYRPYKTQLTLLWVASIPAVAAPTDQGVVPTTIPSPFPVTEQDLDQELGQQVAGFAYYHSAAFSGSSPRTSYREATQEFAYAQTSGDYLCYDILFTGLSPVNTIGGLDLAAIERGPENAVSATSTTLVLNAGASGVDSTYDTMYIEILSNGTPAANGQIRKVTSYVGATKTATVPAWGTTPTGTINYRIVRTGARDFGNDQNGASGKPTTTLGVNALNQWMHREIALPAAWDGKTILGAATAMDTAPASVTQTLLVRNAVIKSAAAVLRETIGRHAFTNQSIWAYGDEQNATTTVRLAMTGDSTPTTGVVSLAVARGGAATGTGNNQPFNTTEAVVLTFPAIHFLATKQDTVRWWLHGSITATFISFNTGGNTTLTFRMRRGGLTGDILVTYTLVVNEGIGAAKGAPTGGTGTTASYTIPTTFGLYMVKAADPLGNEDIVFTVQRSNTANVDNGAWTPSLMTLVKS